MAIAVIYVIVFIGVPYLIFNGIRKGGPSKDFGTNGLQVDPLDKEALPNAGSSPLTEERGAQSESDTEEASPKPRAIARGRTWWAADADTEEALPSPGLSPATDESSAQNELDPQEPLLPLVEKPHSALYLLAVVLVLFGWNDYLKTGFWIGLIFLGTLVVISVAASGPRRQAGVAKARAVAALLMIVGIAASFLLNLHFANHSRAVAEQSASQQAKLDQVNSERRKADAKFQAERAKAIKEADLTIAWEHAHPREYAAQQRVQDARDAAARRATIVAQNENNFRMYVRGGQGGIAFTNTPETYCKVVDIAESHPDASPYFQMEGYILVFQRTRVKIIGATVSVPCVGSTLTLKHVEIADPSSSLNGRQGYVGSSVDFVQQ